MKKVISVGLMALTLLFGCQKSVDDLNVEPDNALRAKQGSIQTSSTNGRSISHWFTSGYWTPLICEGVVIDNLEGELKTHCVMFYENGTIPWMIMTYSGSITSQSTGETFIIKETDTYDLPKGGVITFHSNIRGDQGTHIITSAFIDTQTWELTVDRTICQPK
jgi:hypothetical protein